MLDDIILLGQGYFWQQLAIGQKFRTLRRTITEADLIAFVGCTGQTEILFIDATFDGAIKARGRPVPSALTYSLIEGLLMQTLLRSAGLALLEISQKVVGPVSVSDTIYGEVEITDVRPTAKSGRAVVAARVVVKNQRADTVTEYDVKRLIAGVPESEG